MSFTSKPDIKNPSRILRECQKQLKSSTRSTESQCSKPNVSTKSCLKKTSPVKSESSKRNVNRIKEEAQSQSSLDRNSKTWFQVLLESPKKTKPDKVLRTNSNRFEIPCRGNKAMLDSIDSANENILVRNVNSRRFSLLIDMLYDKICETNDTNFLKFIADVRNLLDGVNHPGSKIGPVASELNVRLNPLTDDDKYNLPQLKANEKASKASDNLLKALFKETKDQRELLQNLIVLVSQLREENKMLNKLKDVRKDLELKLASQDAENKLLKERYEKTKRLLEMRDNENEALRRRLSNLRGTVTGKIDDVLENFADHSIELKALNDSIATLPSHQTSFELPIRPASSSPTEDILRSENKKPISTSKLPNCTTESEKFKTIDETSDETLVQKSLEKEAKLKELKENVIQFAQGLEDDVVNLDANDVSLNLSDVTYKWSV